MSEPIPQLSASRPGNIRQFKISGQDELDLITIIIVELL